MSPAPHPADLDPDVLLADCTERRTRASGPGGQHRNKVETAVVLEHRPTGLRGAANERRSLARNREMALRRLRLTLAVGVRTERPGPPSDLWTGRLHGTRIVVADDHKDLAPLLAEALDTLAARDWDGRAAAEHLGVSTSQLVRLLGRHPAALVRWNEERAARGLGALRPRR